MRLVRFNTVSHDHNRFNTFACGRAHITCQEGVVCSRLKIIGIQCHVAMGDKVRVAFLGFQLRCTVIFASRSPRKHCRTVPWSNAIDPISNKNFSCGASFRPTTNTGTRRYFAAFPRTCLFFRHRKAALHSSKVLCSVDKKRN